MRGARHGKRLKVRRLAPLGRRPAPSSWLDDVGVSTYDSTTHPERDLIEACAEVQGLVEREANLANSLSADEEGGETHPVMEECARLNGEILERTIELSDLEARTPEAVARKAALLLQIMGEPCDASGSLLEGHLSFLHSILNDAYRLGTRSRFTITNLVGLEANPPVRAPSEGWVFRHKMQDRARATQECKNLFNFAVDVENEVLQTGVPPTLFVCESDAAFFVVEPLPEIAERRWFGHPETIKHLREKVGARGAMPNGIQDLAGREARIRQLIKAYDSWPGAKQWESSVAISAAADEQGRRADELRGELLGAEVADIDGMMFKAMLFTASFGDMWQALECIERKLAELEPLERRTGDVLVRDALRLAVARGISIQTLAGERFEPHTAESSVDRSAA